MLKWISKYHFVAVNVPAASLSEVYVWETLLSTHVIM